MKKKRIMLIDPQIKNEPLYVDFYDKYYAPIINDQYVCELTPKQVLQIMNSNSYEYSIAVEPNVIEELEIDYEILPKSEIKRYFFRKENK